jgi:phage baseplate assembly protein V
MTEEIIGDLRGIAVQGVVLAVHDAGQVQTIDVQTHDGVIRTGIEVMQAAGFASKPAANGALVLLLAVGADPGNMVALPIGSPATRFGNLADGESVIYGADGARVAIRNGGVIEILAGAEVIIKVPNVTVTATAGVIITGNVTITGNLTVSGSVSDTNGSMQEMRDDYNHHHHASLGSDPTPQMT